MQYPTIDATLVAEQDFRISLNFVLRGPAPEGTFLAALESDGETGYFYSLDSSRGQPFQDGCLIWNQASAEDKPYTAKIYWSKDNTKVLLTINDFPNAIFDFTQRSGCCRTGYPPQLGPTWSPNGHEWQEAMLSDFLPPTPWAALADELEELCSIDARFENTDPILIVDTCPSAFLGNPAKAEQLFSVIGEKLPDGAEFGFYSAGERLIIVATADAALREAVATERGYVSQAM